MKTISNKDIQDYSNSEDFEYVDTIGGTLPKGFVRLDNKYLKNYLMEAIKPGCKYVTHIDDFVRETYDLKRKNIPLKYVSVMLKDKEQHQNSTSSYEVIGSRIANALGVPTVYNELVTVSNKEMILSIDCVKPGMEIRDLNDSVYVKNGNDITRIRAKDFTDFPIWEELFDAQFRNKKDLTQDEIDFNKSYCVEFFEYPFEQAKLDEYIEKFKTDFVKQYLLKTMILDDWDFYPRNVNYLTNTSTKEFHLGPACDYEYILAGYADCAKINNFYEGNIKYLMHKYPQQTLEFGDAFYETFFENGKLSRIKVNQIMDLYNNKVSDQAYKNFIKNLTNFDKYYSLNLENYKNELVTKLWVLNI